MSNRVLQNNGLFLIDALTYSFSLRNDVQFHKHELFGQDSTRVVNARDIEYSFNRLKDKKLASPGSWTLNKVESFSAVNDTYISNSIKASISCVFRASNHEILLCCSKRNCGTLWLRF